MARRIYNHGILVSDFINLSIYIYICNASILHFVQLGKQDSVQSKDRDGFTINANRMIMDMYMTHRLWEGYRFGCFLKGCLITFDLNFSMRCGTDIDFCCSSGNRFMVKSIVHLTKDLKSNVGFAFNKSLLMWHGKIYCLFI